MECIWDTALLGRGEELPTELLYMIQHGSNEQYLATFTTTLLDARYTYTLLAHCEDLLPHICACLRKYGSIAATTAALGRVVPFAPYLMLYATQLLENEHYSFHTSVDNNEDLFYLLGLFRLLRYSPRVLRRHVRSDELAMQLGKRSRPVTYLILRILQLCLDASDDWFEEAVKRFLGADTADNDITGTWDQEVIDYRFLSFWEEDKHDTISMMLSSTKRPSMTASASQRVLPPGVFHPSTALVAGIILPRSSPHTGNKSSEGLIQTSTTSKNLALFARSLRSSRPILLSGLAGSGKSLLVRHLAGTLGKLDSLVTLHLNEQSDAKLLLGIYTAGTTPGSFVWKPGVLTTAVQEGRWVLIEDLDRAPNEILGTLVPLVEKRQLLIANRKETIYAAEGFRILATVRTSINHRGSETKPSLNLLGFRHWQQISIAMPSTAEHATIARELFPCLKPLLSQLMAVYERLLATRQHSVLATQSKMGVMRPISPRDLLKWCSRTDSLLKEKTTFTSNDIDAIFLECIDCFVGSLPDDAIRNSLAAIIAEELQVDPHRRDYLLTTRDVLYESAKSKVTIGRYAIPKVRQSLTRQSHFSTNPHTARMLERVTAAVLNKEPLLLVGETGVGKTTAVQHLATVLGRKLIAFNLSQQSEAGDLLGGFKPVSARTLMVPMKDEFDKLFLDSFSSTKNKAFLDLLGKQMAKSNWKAVCKLWHQALGMVTQQRSASPSREGETPSKRRKVVGQQAIDFSRWEAFAVKVRDMERQLANSTDAFAFTFVEGNIVKAVRNGDWVLLDEINLASPDTLESVADLLDSSEPSLLLTEAGNIERVIAHPDFRIFAAMNPATDVGKKDLPPGIRSLFTELYVESPDNDIKSLQSIVRSYLREEAASDTALASDLSLLYQKIISLATNNRLVDGSGQKPHFSLRTLTRTLSYSKHIQQTCHIRRALYEGFQMSFLTFLDAESAQIVQPLIMQHLFGRQTKITSELRKPLRKPDDGRSYVQGHPSSKHWLRQGPLDLQDQPQYIITPFIANNLENLVRATSTRQFPVLIQGPTSSGKTSMIEYLAKRTGHPFTRINNHEHTDVNEYLGTYTSTSDGHLQFQEGVLVKALREGHWLVLDELNLAPTDVLEALNRLLDDNRELLIPETQETVRPHPNFMLFATQNPAGLYGGRKALSRAFRNRFLELHFDDIPVNELQDILHRRTSLPESRCKRIVRVYRELSILRQESRLFEQKSFATLRDLFRWAQRQNDTIEELAANGFMLLCERVRKHEERVILKAVIEKVMSEKGPRVHIDEDALYGSDCAEVSFYEQHASRQDVVWTRAMRRLYVLVSRAIANHEPVLLVGETGCGKTTVCQMFAAALQKQLHTVNAHQSTETGDLIGSQRPVRNRGALELSLRQLILGSTLMQQLRLADSQPTQVLLDAYDAALNTLEKDQKASYLQSSLHCDIQSARTRFKALFEWADGSLVNAMREGALFLLDEISLADDSVLERINSVLESERTILLAEKGSLNSFVRAAEGFEFLATMNPGGDYGKRELSPALRNRFTEIWVPGLSDMGDILDIVRANLVDAAQPLAEPMVAFSSWFKARFDTSASSSISVRDTLAWVQFVNMFASLDREAAIVHGAAMVYIDTLGANPAGLMSLTSLSLEDEREICLRELGRLSSIDAVAIYNQGLSVTNDDARFGIGPFFVARQTNSWIEPNIHFSFEPPTTRSNAMRVLRALQLTKPVMLEGSPGVGKTALVTAIAKAAGIPLTRINLSDQTDLLDLFGSDVPVEGAQTGTFVWRDAPFLRAMKSGEWVLLDEMNLASQSVLEGLNACLDHRGEVFVPELGQVFLRHPHFRLFAAQNPHHQGGGRKGLPASFVNRFTVVYADSFRSEDLLLICKTTYPQLSTGYLEQIVAFVTRLNEQINNSQQFAANGGPWEFNLRDIIRWLALVSSNDGLLKAGSSRDFVDMLFKQRFRSTHDRSYLHQLYNSIFDPSTPLTDMYCGLSTRTLQVGMALLPRSSLSSATGDSIEAPARPVIHLRALQAVMLCVSKAWPVILAGPPACGKTYLIEQLAECIGAEIVTIPMSADTDALDLIGGYEQFDPHRQRTSATSQLIRRLCDLSKFNLIESIEERIADLLRSLRDAETGSPDTHALSKLIALMPDHVQHELQALLRAISRASQSIDKAKFEWIDGPLVEALQLGKWLVLDNANLCNASVLDRLNSLLEPDGSLIINEHSTEEGLPRVIRPHEAFRIFLTVDPRSGELSRAMRNRAVELYLLPEDNVAATDKLYSEAALARMRVIKQLEATNKHALSIASDHLGYCDMQLLPRLQRQLDKGLFSIHKTLPKPAPVTFPMENLGFKIEEFYQELSSSVQIPADFACVQTIHPLNNSSLAQQSQYSLLKSLSLATQFDLTVASKFLADELASIGQDRKISEKLSRFWKSFRQEAETITKARNAGILQHIREFLNITVDAIGQIACSSKSDLADTRIILNRVHALCWSFAQIMRSKDFNLATLSALISLGQKMVAPHALLQDSSLSPSLHQLSKALDDLTLKSTKGTGKGLLALWQALHPEVPASMDKLNALIKFEGVIDKFDDVSLGVQLPLPQIVDLRQAFLQALKLSISTDTKLDSLVQQAIAVAPSQAQNLLPVIPHFTKTFELLCQHFACVLLGGAKLPPLETIKLEILARRRTTESASLCTELDCISPHQKLSLLSLTIPRSHQENENGTTINESILQGKLAVGDVSLRNLSLLELEVQVLGSTIGSYADLLDKDDVSSLKATLKDLTLTVLQSLAVDEKDTKFTKYASQLLGSMNKESIASDSDLILSGQAAIEDNTMLPLLPLRHVIDYLRSSDSDSQQASTAWAKFAITCLHLYIPEREYDPVQEMELNKAICQHTKDDMHARLNALLSLQKSGDIKSESLRVRLLREDIEKHGPVPVVQEICRPPQTQIPQLQNEFQALLRTIQHLRQKDQDGHTGSTLVDANSWNNLQVIRQRLQNQYRPYSDLTSPVIGFIDCLSISRHLRLHAARQQATSSLLKASITPLAGATLQDWMSEQSLLREYQKLHTHDERLDWLSLLAARESICSTTSHSPQLCAAIESIFFSFYQTWRAELSREQKVAAAKSSLYQYRGGDNDSEEASQQQLDELFPPYDDSTTSTTSPRGENNVQTLASTMAALYHAIYNPTGETTHNLISLLQQRSQSAPSLATSTELPATLLYLDKLNTAILQTPRAQNINIYVDTDIRQSRSLASLVTKVRSRFEFINNTWPEHATPIEVLRSCDQILAFSHAEPIARFLPPLDKLHANVNEWQKITSSEFSASALLDEIVNLIVSWRRLELSTWAGMFDTEDKLCRQQAASWWYIAYESIICGFEDARQGHIATAEFRKSLVTTLTDFMTHCGIGEYSSRLAMIQDFRAALGTQGGCQGDQIRTALASLISFYSRFDSTVKCQLSVSRKELEKEIQNIIQLASWKDRNIETLRQSAKASHRKLFRIVRKYRQLLSRSVASIIWGSFPYVNIDTENFTSGQPSTISSSTQQLDQEFRAQTATSRGSTTAISKINSFIHNLENESSELRKATPSTRTEENKSIVQHLKTRKRRLFADVLRDLRLMGFRTNISEEVMLQQRSFPLTLSRASPLSLHGASQWAEAADQELHRLLHIMPSARESAIKHSDDLTPAEVTRSKVLLESMLHETLEHRCTVVQHLTNLTRLKSTLGQLAGLCSSEDIQIQTPSSQHLEFQVKSLRAMLGASAHCIEAQGRLCGKDYSYELTTMHSAIDEFGKICNDFLQQAILPQQIKNENTSTLRDCFYEGLKNIKLILDVSFNKHPELEPTLRPLLGWTREAAASGHSSGQSEPSVISPHDWTQRLSQLSDTILPLPLNASATLVNGQINKAWLLNEQETLLSALREMQLEAVGQDLADLLSELHQVDFDAAGSSAQIISSCRKAQVLLSTHATVAEDMINTIILLHATTSKMANVLATFFLQLTKQGFCQPSEKAEDDSQKSGQVESGTGLGEGEGGEDISKDIGNDEDLSELAQEATSKEHEEGAEAEKDAVDMADEDFEGDLDKDDVSQDEGQEEGQKDHEDSDIDEEAGHVDEKDPGTVDEKILEAQSAGEAEKEAKNDKGVKDEDISAATDRSEQQDLEQPEDDADDVDFTNVDDSNLAPNQPEQTDPHLDEEGNLDLPEDLNMDADKDEFSDISDAGSDPADDMDDGGIDQQDGTADSVDVEMSNQQDEARQEDTDEAATAEQAGEPDADREDQLPDVAMLEDQDKGVQPEDGFTTAEDGHGPENENAVDTFGAPSGAEQLDNEDDAEQSSAQPGNAEGANAFQDKTGDGKAETGDESHQRLPYKQLGDILKQWYNNHRSIESAQESDASKPEVENLTSMEDMRFEHTDEAGADMQAVGATSTEQSTALNENNAVDLEKHEPDSAQNLDDPKTEMPNAEDEKSSTGGEGDNGTDLAAHTNKTFVGNSVDEYVDADDLVDQMSDVSLDEISNVDDQLTRTHLSTDLSITFSIEDARQAWAEYESRTRNMAVVLTEHLRLILQPTQATKMRGDFRTGKRLNIKKIIPYIASSYKRDKIWMRRSMPSKRSYQIMLAIDDSESMNEGERRNLAFETLALVAKSLSMLEVGELCIVGFGETVHVNHDFATPFTSDAGPAIVRQFGFSQTKTEVRKLLERSIQLFREARHRASGSASDLWQLQLIISDGLCEDHPSIRRLVRQAHEEQIMIVFIVVDATALSPQRQHRATGNEKQSILDLQRAEFSSDTNGDPQITMIKYLDTFPFRYYLIVRDVMELPSVLAGALKQWFAEVAET